MLVVRSVVSLVYGIFSHNHQFSPLTAYIFWETGKGRRERRTDRERQTDTDTDTERETSVTIFSN